jgi:hypothetical protein
MAKLKYTKEELKQILINEYKYTRKFPIAHKMKAPSHKTFIQYFGSWNQAMIETFGDEYVNYKQQEIDDKKKDLLFIAKIKYKRLKRILIHTDFSEKEYRYIVKYFGRISNLLKEANLPYNEVIIWSKEQLIEKLKERIIELNRIPNVDEMCSPYPSYRQYYKFWDSWEDVLIEAGYDIEPNSKRNLNMPTNKKL